MRLVVRFCLVLLLYGIFHPLYAQNGEPQFGFRKWSTSGQTTWRHDASVNPYFGVPTSELDYQNVDSEVYEVSLLTPILTRQLLRVSFGFGDMNSGRLVDDDYLSAEGAIFYGTTVSGHHRFSRTYSDIDDGSLFYLKAELLPESLVFTPAIGRFRVNLAAQFWQERYRAFGILQVECTDPDGCSTPGSYGFDGVNVISNKVQWFSFGVTVEGLVPVTSRLQLFLNTSLYPLVSLNNEDIHHLRGNLSQSPSIRMTGIGTGYDLELGARFVFSKQFSIHLGYQLWQRDVSNQTITFYGADGGASTAKLMDFSTKREGYMLGINLAL